MRQLVALIAGVGTVTLGLALVSIPLALIALGAAVSVFALYWDWER